MLAVLHSLGIFIVALFKSRRWLEAEKPSQYRRGVLVPLRSGPLCSSASQLLWQSLTSRDRASPATAPRLPDADRRRLPNGRSRDLPVPAQGASAHARVFYHAGPLGPCGGASETCCLPHSKP